MSQPFRRDFSFSGTVTNTAGDEFLTKTHDVIGLFVDGEGVTTLDMTVQGSPDGDNWTDLNADDGEGIYDVTDADLDANGNYYTTSHSFAIELIRPYITDFDGTSLDIYLFMTGQTSGGTQYNRNLSLNSP